MLPPRSSSLYFPPIQRFTLHPRWHWLDFDIRALTKSLVTGAPTVCISASTNCEIMPRVRR